MFHAKPHGVTAVLAAAFLLSGCVSFGGKPPERLLSLDAAHKVPSGTPRVAGNGRTLIVTLKRQRQSIRFECLSRRARRQLPM